jgi:hypothetical protein
VKSLCFDLDPEKLQNPGEAASKILDVCFREREENDEVRRPRIWSHCIILEASRYPDPSYHIWILFLFPLKAKIARWLGMRILELAGLNPKYIEMFPKQEEITPERPYGNFVKLPFGFHQAAGKWSRLLDFNTFQPLPLARLEEKHGLSFSESDLEKLERRETKKTVQTSFQLPKTARLLNDRDEEETVNFLCKYWRTGYRNRLQTYFLGFCLKKCVSHESAYRIVDEVTRRMNDEERQSRLSLVDYHYRARSTVALKGKSGLREIIGELPA